MTRSTGPLMAFVLILAAAASAPAAANELEVNSGYVFEKLAFTGSKKPTVSGNVDFGSGAVTGNVWGQWGPDQISREVDFTANYTGEHLYGYAGLYVTDGYQPIYTAAIGLEQSLGPMTFVVEAQRYEGGLKSSLVSVAGSHTLDLGGIKPTVTLGKAFNWGEVTANPWFARLSLPLGSSARSPVLTARGYVADGDTGASMGITFPL